MKGVLAVFAAVVLTACAASSPGSDGPSLRTDPIPYSLDGAGVQLENSALRIDFDRTDHSTIPAMTKLVGRGPKAQADCAPGVLKVSWPDGTDLYFQEGEFRGWTNAENSAGLTCA